MAGAAGRRGLLGRRAIVRPRRSGGRAPVAAAIPPAVAPLDLEAGCGPSSALASWPAARSCSRSLRPQAVLAQRVPEFERRGSGHHAGSIRVDARARRASRRASARATHEIRNFPAHKPEGIDRVGLVGFADALADPVRTSRSDLDTVAFYLDWIERDPQTLLGTDIGAALKSAMEVAKKDDRKTRKIFLIVSDGEDYGQELDNQVARSFASQAITSTASELARDQPVPDPDVRPDGREVPLRDEHGRHRQDEVLGGDAAADRLGHRRPLPPVAHRRRADARASTESCRASGGSSAGGRRPSIAISIRRGWPWRPRPPAPRCGSFCDHHANRPALTAHAAAGHHRRSRGRRSARSSSASTC